MSSQNNSTVPEEQAQAKVHREMRDFLAANPQAVVDGIINPHTGSNSKHKKIVNDRQTPTEEDSVNGEDQGNPSVRKSPRLAKKGKKKQTQQQASPTRDSSSHKSTNGVTSSVSSNETEASSSGATIVNESSGSTEVTVPSKKGKKAASKVKTADPKDSETDASSSSAANVQESNESAAVTAPAKKGNKTATKAKATKSKGKKTATEATEPRQSTTKGFVGTPNHRGSSEEKPEGAPNDVSWQCANRDCNTGQTYHERDGKDSYGRKTISHFYGRNKKETKRIHPDVWMNYCRKCYQRTSYREQRNPTYHLDIIAMQNARLQIWRAQATFTVQLWKDASKRLADYYEELAKNPDDKKRAELAVTKPLVFKDGKAVTDSFAWAFPIDLLAEFKARFCKQAQTYRDLDKIIDWVKDLAGKKNPAGEPLITCVPPMEFLIDEKADGEETDPTKNYDMWCDFEHERDDQLYENDNDYPDQDEASVVGEDYEVNNRPHHPNHASFFGHATKGPKRRYSDTDFELGYIDDTPPAKKARGGSMPISSMLNED